MRIDAVMKSPLVEDSGVSGVEALESRLLRASEEMMGSKRPDPAIDLLIQQLMAMEGRDEKAIYDYLRSLRAEGGDLPAYPTTKALMAVTNQVMVRLFQEGLQKSQLYKEVSGANGLAFALDMFVRNTLRVFDPPDEDSWEKSEW